MKKTYILPILLCCGALWAPNASADESSQNLSNLRANFRRVALDIASTEVQNGE